MGSRRFFWGVLALLVIEALWIAFTSRYPMAFDEDFHLGVIRLYAHHGSPFWASQPENADRFGAIARDPSYLYHYLMSFPYRLISLFTDNQATVVILLRLLNVAMFAGGLDLYRRLLCKTKASHALVHLCILLFVLLPIVPLLAAQINYDNMLLPLTAGCLLLALEFKHQITARRPTSALILIQLLTLCMATSLVKYAFLPVFIAIVGFVIITTWQLHRRTKAKHRPYKTLINGYKSLGKLSRWGLLVGLVVATGMFTERYGLNVAHYHTPVPDCGQILSFEQCKEYGPWIRDHNFVVVKTHAFNSPFLYMNQWLYGMWLRTFFAIGGVNTDYQTRGPLIVPAFAAIAIVGLGVVAFTGYARSVWRRYNSSSLWLLSLAAGFYTTVLWLDEYRAYLRTGQPVAINGRYLLPVLLPLILIGALSVNVLIKRRQSLKILLAMGTVLCFMWGGGLLTYILRSNDSWYWSNAEVRAVNHVVQEAFSPITPGFYQETQFLH